MLCATLPVVGLAGSRDPMLARAILAWLLSDSISKFTSRGTSLFQERNAQHLVRCGVSPGGVAGAGGAPRPALALRVLQRAEAAPLCGCRGPHRRVVRHPAERHEPGRRLQVT